MSAKKRILIADNSLQLAQALLQSSFANSYSVEIALSGRECLEKLEKDNYDLLIIELFISGIHGIEILKKVRAKSGKKIGIFITSSQPMFQNYSAALKQGADYFLNKPFSEETLFSLINHYFSNTLPPPAFIGAKSIMAQGEECYLPKLHTPNSYIKLWGTRGSTSVGGSEHTRFGGLTVSAEVRHGKDLIIIDAGTGLSHLAKYLQHPHSKNFHIFISHTHFDHITGFPFFYPLYDPEATINIWTPVGFEKTTKELFSEIFAYEFFPVRLDEIKAKIIFHDLRDDEPVVIGNIKVECQYTFHPGITVCFKVTFGNKSFGYATDNEMLMGYHGKPKDIAKTSPLLQPYKNLIDFFRGCHLLIHEAQYTPTEYLEKVGWGHSSLSNAAVLVREAGVKEWILTHHDPKHTDKDLLHKEQLLLDILKDCDIDCSTRLAYDEFLLPI